MLYEVITIEKNFLTIREDADLSALVRVIADSTRDIFVVVDDENTLKGIISLNDIRHLMFKRHLYRKTFVKDLMYMPEIIRITSYNVCYTKLLRKYRNG